MCTNLRNAYLTIYFITRFATHDLCCWESYALYVVYPDLSFLPCIAGLRAVAAVSSPMRLACSYPSAQSHRDAWFTILSPVYYKRCQWQTSWLMWARRRVSKRWARLNKIKISIDAASVLNVWGNCWFVHAVSSRIRFLSLFEWHQQSGGI